MSVTGISAALLVQENGYLAVTIMIVIAVASFAASWQTWVWAVRPSLAELHRLADTDQQRDAIAVAMRWAQELSQAGIPFYDLDDRGAIRRDRFGRPVRYTASLPLVVESFYLAQDLSAKSRKLGVATNLLSGFFPLRPDKQVHGCEDELQSRKRETVEMDEEDRESSSCTTSPANVRSASSKHKAHFLQAVSEERLQAIISLARAKHIIPPGNNWMEPLLLEAHRIIQREPHLAVGKLAARAIKNCLDDGQFPQTVGDSTMAKILGDAKTGNYAAFRVFLLEQERLTANAYEAQSDLFHEDR